MKPDVVKIPPPSNCSETIGPITMPAMPPMPAATAYEMIVMSRTLMPISAAAAGFSEHARSALPSVVRCSTYHSANTMRTVAPASHGDCVGKRRPKSVSMPAVRITMPLGGSFRSAGSRMNFASSVPTMTVTSNDARKAIHSGQNSTWWNV